MDTFREPTPAEMQETLINFMGQTHGELHALNNNIVSEASTLQRGVIDHKKIMASIPQLPTRPVESRPTSQIIDIPISVPVTVQEVATTTNIVPQHPTKTNVDQLEFDFDKCHYSETIFEELRKINNRLLNIESLIGELSKKKNPKH